MAQAQLPEAARRVLGVDEEEFKKVVEGLARAAVFAPYYTHMERLWRAEIVLGRVRPGERGYEAVVEVPFCRHNYGDGRGVVSARVRYTVERDMLILVLELRCAAARWGGSVWGAEVASISLEGQAVAQLWKLHHLYDSLYRVFGIGAKPLLELARKAEEKGDRELADVLRKLFVIMDASAGAEEEAVEKAYSRVAAGEAGEVLRRALRLLREAKRAAEKGDAERLNRLLGRAVLDVGEDKVTLGDIVGYLVEEEEEWDKVRVLLARNRPDTFRGVLKTVGAYDAFISVAERLGLEVRR